MSNGIGVFQRRGAPWEQSPTFADVSPSLEPRFVFVLTDETNTNTPTLYFHNGVDLKRVTLA